MILTLITGVVLIAFRLKEPRSLFYGASFILFSICLAGLFGYVFFDQGWILRIVPMGLIGVISILMIPIVVSVVLVYSRLSLSKREDSLLSNILLLIIGMGLVLYLAVWPIVADLAEVTFFNSVYGYAVLLVFYFVSLLNLYTVTSLLNLIHLKNRPLDYLVVLGAGLAGERVTPVLATRIDLAIKLHHKHPATKLIMTGGQGHDELVAEGFAMAKYALAKGVAEEAIIIEDKAANTEENIAFSYALIENTSAKIGVVTNNYHVLRALILAKNQGFACTGYGARANWYFSIHAYMREFVAYLYMKRHLHFWGIFFLTIFYCVIQGANLVSY